MARGYIAVPRAFIRGGGLKYLCKGLSGYVLLAIMARADSRKDNWAVCSELAVAQDLDVTDRAVRKAIVDLVKRGFLVVKQGRPNRYKLTDKINNMVE